MLVEGLADRALLESSLEAVAETGVDIVPRFFARFHDALPGQRERFYNARSSEGQMVAEIVGMLLAQAGGETWLPTMLRASINTHHDHGGIALEHYRVTLDCLVEVLRECAGAAWRPDFEAAWQTQTAQLLAQIEKYY